MADTDGDVAGSAIITRAYVAIGAAFVLAAALVCCFLPKGERYFCWRHDGPRKQPDGGSCCCLCCAPRAGPEDEEGAPLRTSRWLPEHPLSVESQTNRTRICLTALFCPSIVVGQLWHNLFADRSDHSTHQCCARPFSSVFMFTNSLLFVAILIMLVGILHFEKEMVDHGWFGKWLEWKWRPQVQTAGFGAFLLFTHGYMILFMAFVIRIRIRKRDHIPERCTGQTDAACCECSKYCDCEVGRPRSPPYPTKAVPPPALPDCYPPRVLPVRVVLVLRGLDEDHGRCFVLSD